MHPRTERRLMLLAIVTMLAVTFLFLALAPGMVDTPALEDVQEDSDAEEEATRGDGFGEPDEVVEGFECGPADEGK